MIREPGIRTSTTTANPLMILGIFIFISPFILNALGGVSEFVGYILYGLGAVMFIVGGVGYAAENM